MSARFYEFILGYSTYRLLVDTLVYLLSSDYRTLVSHLLQQRYAYTSSSLCEASHPPLEDTALSQCTTTFSLRLRLHPLILPHPPSTTSPRAKSALLHLHLHLSLYVSCKPWPWPPRIPTDPSVRLTVNASLHLERLDRKSVV